MQLGVTVSDGPNTVSHIWDSFNHPVHISLFIILTECIMHCFSDTKNFKYNITRCQRQQTHISAGFVWYSDPRSKSNILKFLNCLIPITFICVCVCLVKSHVWMPLVRPCTPRNCERKALIVMSKLQQNSYLLRGIIVFDFLFFIFIFFPSNLSEYPAKYSSV